MKEEQKKISTYDQLKVKSPRELAPGLYEIVTTTRAICSGYLVS